MLCQFIGEPIKQLAKLIGEPIKERGEPALCITLQPLSAGPSAQEALSRPRAARAGTDASGSVTSAARSHQRADHAIGRTSRKLIKRRGGSGTLRCTDWASALEGPSVVVRNHRCSAELL